MIRKAGIDVPQQAVADFCQRWNIVEMAVLDSDLGDSRGGPLELLVTFSPNARWTLFELPAMEEELGNILEQSVVFVTRASAETIENPYRKPDTLDAAQIIYVAR